MFKVGDEVFIKAEITDVHRECDKPYFVHPNLDSLNWVSEEKVFPADKTYTQGLADAWELVRKLGEIEQDEREKMFSYRSVKAIIEDCTIEEVMDRIEAYEKKNEIKVGDVVKGSSGNNAVVIHVDNDSGLYFMVYGDGLSCRADKKYLEKTGKHIDIESLLKQIGE